MAGGALGVGGGTVTEHEQAGRRRIAGELGSQRAAQCGTLGRTRQRRDELAADPDPGAGGRGRPAGDEQRQRQPRVDRG
jgi:hypothetical protein